METKNKIFKIAKISYIISKVLYCLACILTLVFIVLSIVLSATNAIKTMTSAETAVLFGTFALYAFISIGLLWNVEGLFKCIIKEKTPFNDGVSHYLKKMAIFTLALSLVPALVGSTIIKIVYPKTSIVFPIEIGGVIIGIVLVIVCVFFKYGKELQQRDDETL